LANSALSEETGEMIEEEDEAAEIIVEIPIAEGGNYLYVCEQCGFNLTEIPTYNRFYCENCGLHY
jgi:anaerobic ribonucleoside-triphosphate reductase